MLVVLLLILFWWARALWLFFFISRWISLKMDQINAILLLFPAYTLILLFVIHIFNSIDKSRVSPSGSRFFNISLLKYTYTHKCEIKTSNTLTDCIPHKNLQWKWQTKISLWWTFEETSRREEHFKMEYCSTRKHCLQ